MKLQYTKLLHILVVLCHISNSDCLVQTALTSCFFAFVSNVEYTSDTHVMLNYLK